MLFDFTEGIGEVEKLAHQFKLKWRVKKSKLPSTLTLSPLLHPMLEENEKKQILQ